MTSYTITADTDTRDGSELFVLKIADKLSREAYQATATIMKALGGYYSKFKHGFIFREQPTASVIENALQGCDTNTTTVKTVNNIHGVKVGDIFYTSWGYEQTNVDFFEVVAVTEKMATVKPIRKACRETGFMQGKVTPIPGEYIEDSWLSKDVIKTRTNKWGDNTPTLKNADGKEHVGYLYTDSPISCSWYA